MCPVCCFSWGRIHETVIRCHNETFCLCSSSTTVLSDGENLAYLTSINIYNIHLNNWKWKFWMPKKIRQLLTLDAGRWCEARASTAWVCSICRRTRRVKKKSAVTLPNGLILGNWSVTVTVSYLWLGRVDVGVGELFLDVEHLENGKRNHSIALRI